MSNSNIIAGLDVGSGNIKLVVAEASDSQIRIVGADQVDSFGVRRGSVIDAENVSENISILLDKTKNKLDVDIKEVLLSVGGTDIKTQEAKGVVAISRASGEVGEDDIERVLEAAQSASMPINSEIIHTISKEYKLDDQAGIRNPSGMNGIRLEVEALMIEDSVSHLDNLVKSVEMSGLRVGGLIVNSIAASEISLDKNQKELGVVLIDIGAGTTTVSVFEEGEFVDIAVLPIGAGHITNDIAIGLRVSVDLAERVKIKYGNASLGKINKRENIDLSEIDPEESELVSRYYVAEIIEARVKEIFDMVNEELKKMGKAGLLPAGAVLVGGGAELPGVVELAKERLSLPAKVGYPMNIGGVLNEVDSPSFSVAVGMTKYENGQQPLTKKKESKYSKILSSVGGIDIDDTKKRVRSWMDKFLP